jgi:hypothetical protein
LAALHLNANPASSRLSVPISAGAGEDRRFVSYNMTHGRAISPVVSNYFGLPTERESEKPSSMPFFGGASRAAEGETEYGALNFLSKKLRDRYGFLAGETATAEAASAVEEDDDDEDAESSESSDSSDTDEEDHDEDDDDDGGEYIDLFGHR